MDILLFCFDSLYLNQNSFCHVRTVTVLPGLNHYSEADKSHMLSCAIAAYICDRYQIIWGSAQVDFMFGSKRLGLKKGNELLRIYCSIEVPSVSHALLSASLIY